MTRETLLLELERTREELRAEKESHRREREMRAEREAELARKEREVEEKAKEITRLLLENDLLRARVDQLARRMFGKSSEKIDASQLSLAFEAARAEAILEDQRESAAGEETQETPPRPRRVRPSKKKSLADLPVRVVRVEPPKAERVCASCGTTKTPIGHEVSEQLDYVPSSIFIVRTERVKVACPSCHENVSVAPKEEKAIEKCLAASGLLAHVVTQKVADHLPLYRQEEIFLRQGAEISRTTLRDWVAAVARTLEPIAKEVMRSVFEGRVVNTDDTPVTYLLEEKGRATGFVWAYVGERNEVAYDFTESRARDGPGRVLSGYRGFLQADAFPGYDAFYADGTLVEVGCWAHARRYFFEAKETDRAEAEPILLLIARLYAIEKVAKERSDLERKLLRQERARPILQAIKARVDGLEGKVLPKGPLGKAISYAQKNWKALTRYLDEGFLAIDNNSAERAIRPIALGRKNWLFAGSADAGRRAATLMTLVNSCKLLGVDPFAYLKDVLVRLPTTAAASVKDLTPRAWSTALAATTPAATI